jgi:hypothetical protein
MSASPSVGIDLPISHFLQVVSSSRCRLIAIVQDVDEGRARALACEARRGLPALRFQSLAGLGRGCGWGSYCLRNPRQQVFAPQSTNVHTHAPTHTPSTNAPSLACARAHEHTHARTHTHTHSHTYSHTYSHTKTHTPPREHTRLHPELLLLLVPIMMCTRTRTSPCTPVTLDERDRHDGQHRRHRDGPDRVPHRVACHLDQPQAARRNRQAGHLRGTQWGRRPTRDAEAFRNPDNRAFGNDGRGAGMPCVAAA